MNADTGLIAPDTGGGQQNNAALSHITFCYTPDKTPPAFDAPAPKNPPASETPAVVVETPPATQEQPPAATVTPAQPAAQQPQIAVLGQVVSHKPAAKKAKKKAKKARKAKKQARRKVKAVKVQAVRAPKFTG